MDIGAKGIKLIKDFEGFRSEPYMCQAGVWTCGIGHVLCFPSGKQMKGEENRERAFALMPHITQEEADQLLMRDLKRYSARTNARLGVKQNQNQFDALCSHVYNTGGSDTLFDLINTKANIKDIKAWWTTKYITANGIVLNGLKRRRMAEFELYIS